MKFKKNYTISVDVLILYICIKTYGYVCQEFVIQDENENKWSNGWESSNENNSCVSWLLLIGHVNR